MTPGISVARMKFASSRPQTSCAPISPIAGLCRPGGDPASALPGVPGNSWQDRGRTPLYDNFSYTATSGLDFDVQVKLPASARRFSARHGRLRLQAGRTDQRRWRSPDNVGYDSSTSAVPRFQRSSVKLDWKKGGASAWIAETMWMRWSMT